MRWLHKMWLWRGMYKPTFSVSRCMKCRVCIVIYLNIFTRCFYWWKEHKEMQKVFIGILAGIAPSRVLAAACGLLNFIYYAQYQSHTTNTLQRMQEALNLFHANKDIFVDEGIRKDFNIPKSPFSPSLRRLNSSLRQSRWFQLWAPGEATYWLCEKGLPCQQ